jgi:transcriptional regulator with XRE-family HTH domain
MTFSLKLNSAFLKAKRMQLGLKQSEIAERLNMHQTTYSKFETGKPSIKLETLYEVANLLGTDPNELLLMDSDKISHSLVQTDKYWKSDLLRELDELSHRIDDLKKRIVTR